MSPRQVAPTSARRSPSPISLERIDDSLGDIEELLATSSASSTSSMTQGVGRGPKSRFQTFAPYSHKQLAEITNTAAFAPAASSSKHSSPNVKSPPMVSSGKGTPRPLLAQALGKTESGRRPSLQHSSHNSTEVEELDYPDPYGVLPFADVPKMAESSVFGRASSSSGSTARGSLATSRILNASPEPSTSAAPTPKAAHPIAGMTTIGDIPKRSSGKTSPGMSLRPSPTTVPVRVDSPMKRVQLPPPTKPDTPPDDPPWTGLSKEDEFGREVWAAYRRQRTAPLLAWWQAYVEDVSHALLFSMFSSSSCRDIESR